MGFCRLGNWLFCCCWLVLLIVLELFSGSSSFAIRVKKQLVMVEAGGVEHVGGGGWGGGMCMHICVDVALLLMFFCMHILYQLLLFFDVQIVGAPAGSGKRA